MEKMTDSLVFAMFTGHKAPDKLTGRGEAHHSELQMMLLDGEDSHSNSVPSTGFSDPRHGGEKQQQLIPHT